MRKTLLFLSFLLLQVLCYAQQPVAVTDHFGRLNTESDPENLTPPQLYHPQIAKNSGNITFHWDCIPSSIAYKVEYELRVLQGKNTVFTSVSDDCQVEIDPLLGFQFNANTQYKAYIETRIKYDQNTTVLHGENNAIDFIYLPECTTPKNLFSKWNEDKNALTITWDGPLPKQNDVRYEVMYGDKIINESKRIFVFSGENKVTISDFRFCDQLKISLRKLCDGSGEQYDNASDWVSIMPFKVVEEIPDITCSFTNPASGCTAPEAPSNSVFTIIKIKGFSVDVTSWTPNSTNPKSYTGLGITKLPFQNKSIKVSISVSRITINGDICIGEINGLSDLPGYWPNLFPPISPYTEICLPPGTAVGFNPLNGIWMPDSLKWNPQGFGIDGTYMKSPPYENYVHGAPIDTTGTYDPSGFDKDCKNRDTNTEFDVNGCSCWGTDNLGNPCEHTMPPYYWLNEGNTIGPPTTEGLLFATQQSAALNNNIIDILMARKSVLNIKIGLNRVSCDSLRGIMQQLTGDLQYSHPFIFGADSAYIKEGMYKNFTEKPKPLVTNIERDSRTIQLENEHVNLYGCDLNLGKKKDSVAVVNYFATTGLDSLKTVITDLMKAFTAAEVTKYANQDSFLIWLRTQINNQINLKIQETYGGTYGFIDENATDIKRAKEQYPLNTLNPNKSIHRKHGTMLAAADNDLAFLQSLEYRPEDIDFEFAQGFELINGVERVYYLEHIASERRKAELSPELFTGHDSLLQPIEIRKWVGGKFYDVYLDAFRAEMHFNSGEASYDGTAKLNVYLLMQIPTMDQKIALKALNVNITATGPSVIPIKLELNNDIPIRMNNATRIFLEKSAQTFIKVDCDGFAGISLKGKVEVCRNYLVPLDSTTLAVMPEPKRVTGNFLIQIAHWNDFYSSITIDPFAVKGYEDYKWQFNTIILDFSDELSPAGFPPSGYETPFASAAGFDKRWQGIYIEEISLTLPDMFKKNNQNTSVGVERVLFDERGFSGTAFVSVPLISLDEGSAGGWGFSVDNFQLTFIANQLFSGGFGGKINVPILKGAQCNTAAPLTPADCFDYSGLILPNKEYQLTVTIPPNVNYCADLWKAGSVKINSNSSVSLNVENGVFVAKALLHGTIEMSAQIGSFDVSMPDTIAFQNVCISSKAPHFNVGTWKMPSSINCRFAGFGVTVGDVGMANGSNAGEYCLNMELGISLTKEGNAGAQDSLGISAYGNFKINGVLSEDSRIQKWVFKSVKLTSLSVDATFPGATIKGSLAFYNDSTANGWGKGFRGVIDAKFKGTIGAKALAHFGRRTVGSSNFKYFFVDAMVTLPAGNQALAPLDIRGLGGGVFHHMTRDTTNTLLSATPTSGVPGLPATLGVSLSGIKYIPDPTAGIGVKATIAVALAKESAFNGSLSLEILFNAKSAGGGIRSFNLDGLAIFMAPINLGLPPIFNASNQAAVKAKASIAAQFTPSFKLHGSLETFLNMDNLLVGAGAGGRMTTAEFHIEPNLWYINVGTPTDPCGIKLMLGGHDLVTIQAYLDIGKNIPPMPELPPAVRAITGLNSIAQQNSVRGTGRGFAFGAAMTIGSDDKICVPDCNAPVYFYGSGKAQIGFDVMIQDYGDAQCSNTNQPIGINGWYASGQTYALIQSSVGIGVKIFGVKKELEVLALGGAAAGQVKIPNPFWARYSLGGYFSIMGGLVKGDIDFQFTFGETCQIASSSNANLDLAVIALLKPIDKDVSVDVAAHPNVSFNIPIGASFIVNDAISNQNSTFKVDLAYAKLTYRGYSIPADLVWQSDKMNLELIPRHMFPENDSVTFEVKVNIFKDGQAQTPEIKKVTFWTGRSYEEIPDFNVKASYPMDGQVNFHKSEWIEQKGYILLHANQYGLFDVSGPTASVVARITSASGTAFETPATYNVAQSRIDFGLPSIKMQPQTMYKLEIVKKNSVDPNTLNGGGGNSNRPGGPSLSLENPTDNIIYDAYFRTSQYETFVQKINALAAFPLQGADIPQQYGAFKVPVAAAFEPFDVFEIGGAKNIVDATALLDQTPWFSTHVRGLMYNSYAGNTPNAYGMLIDERAAEPFGRIPYKGVYFTQNSGGNELRVTADYFTSGTYPSSTAQQHIDYVVPYYVRQDFHDLCYDVMEHVRYICTQDGDCPCCMTPYCCVYNPSYNSCTYSCNGAYNSVAYKESYVENKLPTTTLKNFFKFTGLNEPPVGTYPISLSYKLPGLTTVTTIKTINLQKNTN